MVAEAIATRTRPRYPPKILGRVLGACLALTCVVAAAMSGTHAFGFTLGRRGHKVQRGFCRVVEGSRVAKMPRRVISMTDEIPVIRFPRKRADGMPGCANGKGSGRRQSVLAYAKAGVNNKGTMSDPTTVRRMWDMYEMEYCNMAIARQRYWWGKHRYQKWMDDWKMQRGEKRKKASVKDSWDQQWLQWMRTEGRKFQLQEQIVYNGPPLGHLLPENAEELEKEAWANFPPSDEQFRKDGGFKRKGWKKCHFPEMEPGQYTEGETALHNVFPHPLKRHLIDVDFRGYGRKSRRDKVVT